MSKAKSERDYEKADEIVAIDQRLLVLQAVLSGKPLAQLARETGIGLHILKLRRKEVAATLVENYHDELEYAKAKATARLEKIYNASEKIAFGAKLKTDKKTGETSWEETGIPDLQWLKFLTHVITTQLSIHQADEKHAAEKREEGQRINYTNVQHLTLVSGQEMFNIAKETMWQEFYGKTPGEMEQMLLEDDTIELAPNLAELSKRVDKLGQHLNDEVPDDDE